MNAKPIPRNLVQASVVAFLILFPHYVPLPFYGYAVVCFMVIIFYLKSQKKNLRNLGLRRNGLTAHALLIGLVSALVWIAFNKWVYHPFITHFFVVEPYTEYDFIRKKLTTLLITLVAAWLVGGFYEEIVFRGFIQKTFQGWLKDSHLSFWSAGLLTSILFGLYHWQQGIFGIIPSFLGGILWTYLLWRYKGNLWYPILSHALYDTIALTLIYLRVVI